MGISDDISPRRNHHITHVVKEPEPIPQSVSDDHKKTEEVKVSTKPKTKTTDESSLFGSNKNDSFFPTEKTATAKKETVKPQKHRDSEQKYSFSWRQAIRNIISITIISLLAILIYSNFDSMKKAVFGDNAKNDSEDSDAVTIVPQDYTSETATSTESADTTATTTEETATPAETAAPAAVAVVVPDKTNTTIKVLNGSNVDGAAATYKSILSKAGYTVTATGNAANHDYWSTYVYYKTGYDAVAADIKTVLKRKSTLLKNDDNMTKDFNIVVIMGSH